MSASISYPLSTGETITRTIVRNGPRYEVRDHYGVTIHWHFSRGSAVDAIMRDRQQYEECIAIGQIDFEGLAA